MKKRIHPTVSDGDPKLCPPAMVVKSPAAVFVVESPATAVKSPPAMVVGLWLLFCSATMESKYHSKKWTSDEKMEMEMHRRKSNERLFGDDLESYTNDYTIQVLVGYCMVYIFMQTFMIPGTVFMSLLAVAGSLFGVFKGVAPAGAFPIQINWAAPRFVSLAR